MRSITGEMVYYYFVCKRKLWYFANYIEMEQESELVEIGSALHESTFSRDLHNFVPSDGVNIDFLRAGEIVHELKKRNSITQANIWQLKFYLYRMAQLGVDKPRGVLHFYEEHATEEVTLSETDILELQRIIEDVGDVITGKIPTAEQLKICRKCAYFELCKI